MTKKSKILLFLIFIIFLLFLYLVITSKPVNNVKLNDDRQLGEMDIKLDENYKKEASRILSFYSRLVKEGEINLDKVKDIKNQLLGLRVPTEFKNLHLSLVFALTKRENYLINGDNKEKLASQQLISQAKANYKWLNIK